MTARRKWLSGYLPPWVKRRPSGIIKFFRSALLIVAATELLVSLLDVFGMKAALEMRAAVVLQRVTASTWGYSTPTPGQGVVTVVLIDKNFTARRDAAGKPGDPVWPPPVTLLTGAIRNVVNAAPAAVFVDLAFPTAPREIKAGEAATVVDSEKELAGQLASFGDISKPPLFIADVIRLNDEQRQLTSGCERDFLTPDEVVGASVMSTTLRKAVFPGQAGGRLSLVDSAVLDASGNYHLAPVQVGTYDTCRTTGHPRYLPSPALALYKAYLDSCRLASDGSPVAKRCRGDERKPDGETISRIDWVHGFQRFAVEQPFESTMFLRWGTRLTPEWKVTYQELDGAGRCESQLNMGFLDPWQTYALLLFGPVERAFEERLARRCLYIDTVLAGDLDKPGIAEKFIKDRIVLIGVDLLQAQDRFASPINGDIPGVYVHAAALENLITRGATFTRGEPTVWMLAGTLVLTVFILAVMDWLWRRLCLRLEAVWPPAGELLFAPLLYALVAFGVAVLLFIGLSKTPMPLVEIALPFVALHLVLFAGWLKRFEARLERWFGGEPPAAH